MPFIVARKVHLVIPVGLEKLVAGDIVDLTLKMREPMESLPALRHDFPVHSFHVAPHGRDRHRVGGY